MNGPETSYETSWGHNKANLVTFWTGIQAGGLLCDRMIPYCGAVGKVDGD